MISDLEQRYAKVVLRVDEAPLDDYLMGQVVDMLAGSLASLRGVLANTSRTGIL